MCMLVIRYVRCVVFVNVNLIDVWINKFIDAIRRVDMDRFGLLLQRRVKS
jgi:hypothetical protein